MILAVGVVAFDPVSVTGYFYHPLMIGLVHLVTLGWISVSILGAIFIVGPLALRMPMPVGRLDYWAFGFYSIGLTGMVSHFWIEQYSGMAWSAGMVLLAVGHVTSRVIRQLYHSRIPIGIRLHVGLACVNLLIACILGLLLGADREVDIVPGFVITNVYAHAHMAGLGWATLMVVGIGHRLLPMVLPSAMPEGPRTIISVGLIQVGVVGLFVTLLVTGQAGLVWTLLALGGVVTFLSTVLWMRRHPRPAPPARPSPDWGVGHAGQSLLYLFVASGIGVFIVSSPVAAWTARLAMLYGVLALVGFLSQIVVGMENRILPLFQWHTRFAASDFAERPAPPHTLGSQAARAVVFWAWTLGVPLLAAGLALERVTLVGLGGWALLVALVLQSINAGLTLMAVRTHAAAIVVPE